MRNGYLWSRTLPTASSFSDDLGNLGSWVGPRTGADAGTHVQKEHYVLRRLLVAKRFQKKLNFAEILKLDRLLA